MKCDELKRHRPDIMVLGEGKALAVMVDDPMGVWCHIQDVHDILDEKDKEIAELKEKLMPCLNGDCILTCEVVEKYGKENAELKQKLESVQASMYADVVDANMEVRRLKRALWLARAERYKMIEFIAREEGNLSNQMSWSRILRDRTYNQWVDQLLRIANLANKLQNKCRAKAEEYK